MFANGLQGRQTEHDIAKLAKIYNQDVSRIKAQLLLHCGAPTQGRPTFLGIPQVAPGHLRGLGNVEQAENCGRDVFKRTSLAEFQTARRFIYQMQRNWISCMAVCGWPVSRLIICSAFPCRQ